MDWHFRQNRRVQNRVTASREWFLSSADWTAGDVGQLTRDQGTYFIVTLFIQAPIFFEEEAKEQKRDVTVFVVASDAPSDQCALCLESLLNSWHEESEEWVFMDCVLENNQVLNVSRVFFH
jgi:hypothetical protein